MPAITRELPPPCLRIRENSMASNKKELSNIAFSRDAAGYDESPKYAPLKACYPAIVTEAFTSPFSTILDVGCGTGTLLSMIRERQKTIQLSGIDLSEEMIRAARAKLQENADLRISDSEDIPFKNASFDLVTCTFSFHHYPNPRAVLLEFRRVLSPGGRLILADPSIFFPLRQLMNLFVPLSKDDTVRFYSKKEIQGLTESAGFEISKLLKLNWHTYMLVAQG
jgi:ubiquinone/menaquinone biosynthesis C-methylase UbiE